MNLLNACLALMLTIGVFASVVTVLVEMIHQIVEQRARDPKGMLEFVFDQGIALDGLKTGSLDVAAMRADFAETLRRDKVLGELVRNHGVVLGLIGQRIANSASMTMEDFLRRLERTDVYKTYLAALNPADLENTLKNLLAEFARAETAISEFFRVRAKLLSFLMGVCLAVFANVDAVRLFESFATNPAQTEQAISQLQGMLAEAGSVGKTSDKSPQVSGATQPGGNAGPTAGTQTEEIAAMLHALRNSQAFGLPVGWAYYPYCQPPQGAGRIDPLCPDARVLPPEKTANAGGLGIRACLDYVHEKSRPFFWFLSVIVTGFLLGLGGPYWFDLAMSLSRLRDSFKSGKETSQDKENPPPDADKLVANFIAKTVAHKTISEKGDSA